MKQIPAFADDPRLRFAAAISKISGRSEEALPLLLQACSYLIPSRFSRLWFVNNQSKTLTMRCQTGLGSVPPPPLLQIDSSVAGLACKSQRPHIIPDIGKPEYRDLFHSWDVAEALEVKRLVLIPLRGNIRSESSGKVEAVLALYPVDGPDPSDLDLETVMSQVPPVLRRLALNDREEIIDTLVTELQRSKKDLNSFLHKTATTIEHSLHVEAVSIFIWHEVKKQLVLGASSTQIKSSASDEPLRKDQVFYYPGEGITGSVFTENKPRIEVDASDPVARSGQGPKYIEITEHPPGPVMWMPLSHLESGRDREQMGIGVVRCINKRAYVGTVTDFFGPSDLDVMNQICKIIAPYIELLQAERRRIALLNRVSHELLSPVVAIRGTADHLLQRRREFSTDEVFSLVEDVSINAMLLRMLCGQTQMTAAIHEGLFQPRMTRIRLSTEVVQPCVDMAKPLAREQRLRFDAIRAFVPDHTVLRSDQWALQLALFNLLTNAIKYRRWDDPESFRVEVKFQSDGRRVSLFVCDWGMGVDAKESESIFEYGVRGINVHRWEAKGIGIGLYNSRRIAKLLGGKLEIHALKDPTIFRLELPVEAGS